MALPEGLTRFIPPGNDEIQKFISSAANQSVRPYNTNEEYLYAMKEDLAEWFKELYEVDIHVDNFMEFLDDGILLCEHANRVNDQAKEFRMSREGDPILKKIILPSKMVRYTPGRHASSFFSRDNVANFIQWCRKELLISDAVMFESNDLILRKNEKNFILCLLEMARRGSKFGVPAPVLIQMEEEIDEEIEQDLREEQLQEQSDVEEDQVIEEPIREPPKQKVACDFKSLDEMVQYILGMCTCPSQFPMVKVSEGKYKVGNSRTLIFMRILRNHVMVRVGGGWDTLEHYLDKHDPCRCNRHKVEQKIASRASQVGPRMSVKQANDIIEKAAPSAKASKDWSHIRTQSLPAYEDKMSAPSGSRQSRLAAQSSEPVRRVTKSFENAEPSSQRDSVQSMQAEITTSRKSSARNANKTQPISRDSKSSTLPRNHKTPEIRITKSSNESLNQTYPLTSKPTRTSNLRASKFETKAPTTNKSPSDSLRSASTGSMSHTRDYRRSLTPTPTSTSQKRAQLSVARSKTPDPGKMMQHSIDNKRTSRTRGPPSSYRNYESLPREHRMMEKAPPKPDARLSTTARESSTTQHRYNSLQRPSSAMAYRSPSDETDYEKRSTLSATKGQSHHGSMPDVRHIPRPKSATGTPTLSTVPRSNTVRKTIANTAQNPTVQRLTARARSQSMDNLSIQKQLNSASAAHQRNQFFDRLSQPKNSATRRSRTNLVDEDVLLVDRKGEGRHSVQRNSSMQRSPRQYDDKKTPQEYRPRENSANSETSSVSIRSQRLGNPPDLRNGNTTNGHHDSTKDSGHSSGLRLSVSMQESPDSSTSRVSYSWGNKGSMDDADSSSAGSQTHTPKIMNRQQQESHLKAPLKGKVPKEEILYVVRNPDGRHQWEHTESSLEQSQEYTELSPYKQFSPRSTVSERPRTSSIRNASSSSESSVLSPTGRARHTVMGISPYAMERDGLSKGDHAFKTKNSVVSPTSSSIASSKSSGDTRRRRPNISEEVRSMLFTEDGRVRPPNNSSTKAQPTNASTPRSSVRDRPTTPRKGLPSQTNQTRYQARPLTPKASTSSRLSAAKPRPKTPDTRRNTLSRQEKLKSFDGPNLKKESKVEPLDKESRMLMELEREYLENQRILSQSGDEDGSGDHGNTETDGQHWEYDYHGRRVRKNHIRSKSASHLRSKSAPRMDRMSSCDSELTDQSFDCGNSIANSEDFEVAMAMSNGLRQPDQVSSRSRSVDNFLEEKGPRPRKDKHESRKSRIPTPVHFNSGRKSATGVPYHDSSLSKSALRSNVEGVSSHEIDSINQSRRHRTARDTTTGNTGKPMQYDTRRTPTDQRQRTPSVPVYHQKENIRPSNSSVSKTTNPQGQMDNMECFTFGRHGNQKNKPSRNTDFVDGRNNHKNFTRSANSNNNNSISSEQANDEGAEPIPPPRKKSGYHRSQLHSSPADLLQAGHSASQTVFSPTASSTPSQHSSFATSQRPNNYSRQIHERNDSGFEPGSDPNSPLSPNVDANSGSHHPRASLSMEERKKLFDRSPQPRVSPEHGVLNTPTGKYYFVTPGRHDPRLHTGYDTPRSTNMAVNNSSHQDGNVKQSNHIVSNSVPATPNSIVSMPHQPPNPSFYKQEGSRSLTRPTDQYKNRDDAQFRHSEPSTLYDDRRDQAPNSYVALNGSNYPPTSHSSTCSNLPTNHQATSLKDDSWRRQYPPTPRDSLQQRKSSTEEGPTGRVSKRRQFSDFFNDNQRLKDSLNRLDQLYVDEVQNPAGSAFQFEELPDDEEQSDRLTDNSRGNPFTLLYTDANDKADHLQSSQAFKKPQMPYQSVSTPRSSRDRNNNASDREYPSMGSSDPSIEIPPNAPPRHKAFEKHRLDPQTGHYTEIRNNSDPNFQYVSRFQKSGSKEEYV